ncbi:hypothetical protein, partial [Methylobacter sp.]|uniref:hypothetical protein n=1 Tax=Methylobacter sp. TaxID=2051955 RepID=UPI003DA4B06D
RGWGAYLQTSSKLQGTTASPEIDNHYKLLGLNYLVFEDGFNIQGYASRTFSNFSVELNPKRYAVRTLPGLISMVYLIYSKISDT